MISAEQIGSKVEQYLRGSMSLEDLEDWILANGWNAHLDCSPDVARLVHRIEGSIEDFHSRAIGLESLHKELATAIPPFAPAGAAPLYAIVYSQAARPAYIEAVIWPAAHPSAIPYWGSHGANNSVYRRVGPQRESGNAFGYPAMPAEVLVEAQS